MYRSIPLAFLAAVLLSAAPIAIDRAATRGVTISTAEAAARVDINVFFTNLASYGSWVPSPNYNYVWVPTNVDANWAPYTNGHWVYTDQYGWYFDSDEPFASIVYHYGRWGYDPQLGWYWVPGTEWAPAWVAWRRDDNDNDIGWAPLPPQGNGYATNINVTINIGDVPDHYWRFVPDDQFLAPQLRTVVFAGDQRPDVYSRSQPSGFVRVQNNVVINNVIDLNFIEQQTKQTVMPTRLDVVTDPKQTGPGASTNGGTSIKAFIASLNPPDKSVKPPKVDNATSLQAPTKGQVNPQQDKSATVFSALTPGSGGNLPAANGSNASGTQGSGPNGSNNTEPNGQPTGTATATPTGGPSEPSNNPRCTDPTFAKNNPKTCGTSGNSTANANPNGGATTTNGSTLTNNGKGPSNPTGNGGPSGGSPTNGKGPASGTANANPNAGATTNLNGGTTSGNGNGGGNANANASSTRCSDPTFAKNNPKTCGGQGNGPGSPGAGGPQGSNATAGTPSNGRTTGNGGSNGNQTNNIVQPKPGTTGGGNAAAGSSTTTALTGQTNGNASSKGTTASNAAASTTAGNCSNPAYARANPQSCGNQDGGNAGVSGGGSAKTNASGDGNAQGNISVQGNAAATCADPTFAKNNPKACPPTGADAKGKR